MAIDVAAVRRDLAEFERRLDPLHPELAGAKVLAYGEISAVLTIDEAPGLQGLVVKRMSGFTDRTVADAYLDLLAEYLQRLHGIGICVLETVPVAVQIEGRSPCVYLVQPFVPPDLLGHRVLTNADDEELADTLRLVLDRMLHVFTANVASRADQISVDAQLSNWAFGAAGIPAGEPALIDMGTPFIRRNGRHAFDQEILLAAVPPGVRAYYRRKGTAAEYMDDYFEPRLIAVDLLGNFQKEGVPQRIPLGVGVVNEWLAGDAGQLQRQLTGTAPLPVTKADVAAYYKEDAATLELFLRVRRLDRAVRRLLRQRYDFILPGKVKR